MLNINKLQLCERFAAALALAVAVAAEQPEHSGEASTNSIAIIAAGLVGVVLVGSALALCGDTEHSSPPEKVTAGHHPQTNQSAPSQNGHHVQVPVWPFQAPPAANPSRPTAHHTPSPAQPHPTRPEQYQPRPTLTPATHPGEQRPPQPPQPHQPQALTPHADKPTSGPSAPSPGPSSLPGSHLPADNTLDGVVPSGPVLLQPSMLGPRAGLPPILELPSSESVGGGSYPSGWTVAIDPNVYNSYALLVSPQAAPENPYATGSQTASASSRPPSSTTSSSTPSAGPAVNSSMSAAPGFLQAPVAAKWSSTSNSTADAKPASSNAGGSSSSGTSQGAANGGKWMFGSAVGGKSQVHAEPLQLLDPSNASLCLRSAPTSPLVAQEGVSVHALASFAREVAAKTGKLVVRVDGRSDRPFTVTGPDITIRNGLACVACTCQESFGLAVEVLFFTREVDQKRHELMCSKKAMKGFCATIREASTGGGVLLSESASGPTLSVPGFLVTEATAPLDAVWQGMDTLQRICAASGLARHLTAQLVTLHSKRTVHCGVTQRNVILLRNLTPLWTFREYCSYVGEGKEMEAARHLQDVRILPPEIASAACRKEPPAATAAVDIWQLGVLLYELFSGHDYWSPAATADEILRDLTTPGGLPHRRDSTKLNEIVRIPELQPLRPIIARMLERDPSKRPTAAALEEELGTLSLDVTLRGRTTSTLDWTAPVTF